MVTSSPDGPDQPSAPPGKPGLLRLWAPLAAGAAIALGVLQFASQQWTFDPSSAALGEQTTSVYGEADGVAVHCQAGREPDPCKPAYLTAGRPPAVLWLGNSQLNGINRHRPGEEGAPVRLHRTLAGLGRYLVTYSAPNANLLEQEVLFRHLRNAYDVETLVLAVCLDDFRETGVRPGLLASTTSEASGSNRASAQTLVEAGLDRGLGERWGLWRDREDLKALVGYAAYVGRNRLLGVTAQTTRRVPGALYAEKLAALDRIVGAANAAAIEVVLYAPPYRTDVPGPYDPSQYARFLSDLQALGKAGRAEVLDLTQTVPGPEWGMLKDRLFGFEDYDFMHFTAEGHRRLAERLAGAI